MKREDLKEGMLVAIGNADRAQAQKLIELYPQADWPRSQQATIAAAPANWSTEIEVLYPTGQRGRVPLEKIVGPGALVEYQEHVWGRDAFLKENHRRETIEKVYRLATELNIHVEVSLDSVIVALDDAFSLLEDAESWRGEGR